MEYKLFYFLHFFRDFWIYLSVVRKVILTWFITRYSDLYDFCHLNYLSYIIPFLLFLGDLVFSLF